MSRADRRLPGDFRPITLVTGISATSQGSARLSYGDTEVICSIHGPKELRFREIDTGKVQVITFTYPERRELNDMISTSVKNGLDCEAYPDSTLQVAVTIVSDKGALVCCAINAVMAAIKDAGLKMKNDIAASAFAIRNGTILVDPSKQEEETSDGVVTFVFVKETGEVFSCYFDGNVEPEVMVALLEKARCLPEGM